MRHIVELNPALPAIHAEELTRRIPFLDAAVLDHTLLTSPETGDVHAVNCDLAEGADTDRITTRVQEMVSDEIRTQLPVPPDIIWRAPNQQVQLPVTFADLEASGDVCMVRPGEVALSARLAALVDALDDALVRVIVTGMGAVEYRYPPTLPLEALQQSGYLASFPHHLMYAARPTRDREVYRDLSARAQAGQPMQEELASSFAPVDTCLPPTMCYHSFYQLRGSTLTEPTLITSRGASFRHESTAVKTLARLSDFTIRETVFLGSADYVRDGRDELRAHIQQLVTALQLDAWVEVANDPFFGRADSDKQASAQRLLQLKQELRIPAGGEGDIACASFNLHGTHFTQAFRIAAANVAELSSACVGVGLERLMYAFVSRHGLDSGQWPVGVQATLVPLYQHHLQLHRSGR